MDIHNYAVVLNELFGIYMSVERSMSWLSICKPDDMYAVEEPTKTASEPGWVLE